jgi:hypothetical protein
MPRFRIFGIVFLSLALSLAIQAQEFRGTILGRVTDPSGGVVPQASVVITNDATGAVYRARTNHEGTYTMPFIQPGTYTVAAKAAGFKQSTRPGVIVQIEAKITLDFALQVGNASESITVAADSPILQTASAEMGQVVGTRDIDRLPVDSDNPMNLVTLAPGVIGGSGDQISNGQNSVSVNGGSGLLSGNDVTVDGIPNVNPRAGGLAVTAPSSDAVQEFKVVTTMFDASNGRSNGGAIAFTTKSGTNDLHGTGFGYWTNAELDANGWQRNKSALPRVPAGKERFGGTVGGPVFLPHAFGPAAYDGRNKTFFFVSYEQIGPNQSNTVDYGHVPTALERVGNFSQTLAPNGAPLAIYNPFTRNSTGTIVSQPFPNATIPLSLQNATGQAVMGLYPLPNQPGVSRISSFNWVATGTSQDIEPNLSIRMDQNFGSSNKMFLRVNTLSDDNSLPRAALPGAYSLYTSASGTGNPEIAPRHNMSAAIDDTHVLSPTWVASFRAGYSRTYLKGHYDGNDLPASSQDLPAVVAANQVAPGYAQFIMGEGMPSFGASIRESVNDTYAYYATFSQTHGNHSFKYGVDARMTRWNENSPGLYQNGRFSFSSAFTSSDPTNSATTNASGTAMASLLLGTASAGGLGYNSALSIQNWYVSGFFQDDIRLTPKLTLNIGMRYELETPPTERYNRIAYGFDPNATLPITVPGLDLKGGLTFAGVNGEPRGSGSLDTNNFGPRFGFAYSVAPKWVVRGGYGIFYSGLLTNIAGFGQVNATALGAESAFNAVTNYTYSTDSGRTPYTTIANPFPNGLVTPTGSSQGLLSQIGNSISFVNPNRVLPYVQQWSFAIQRQLDGNTMIEASYVGSHALKLVSSLQSTTGEYYNLNELPDVYLVKGTPANNKVANPFYGILPATSSLGTSSTTTQGQLWYRFPQFTAVNEYAMNGNNDLYHALQINLQRRFSHGLSLNANYTFSRNMYYDQTSVVNVRKYRTVAATDYPNMFRVFVTYDVPFGRNKTFGSQLPRWADYVAGGWSLSGSYSFTSGDPLTVTQSLGRPTATSDPVYSTSVGSRLGDQLDPKTGLPLNPYFNTNVWTPLPNNYTVTQQPPLYDWLRGPSKSYTNISIFKTFPIRERLRLELRGEIYNPFNSPVFGDPATNMSTPATFGVITTAGGTRNINIMGKIRF